MSANDNAGPFSLGQHEWPGIAKLIEECGEVLQIAGKLIATGGATEHWSGLDLRRELQDELGDLLAAIAFTIDHNELDVRPITHRRDAKLALYAAWHTATDEPSS